MIIMGCAKTNFSNVAPTFALRILQWCGCTRALRHLYRMIVPVLIYLGMMAANAQSIAQNAIETADSHLANCGDQYVQSSLPRFKPTQSIDLYYLCFDGFAVGYSGTTRTAVWSAEHLTRERIEAASLLERENQFHEESRLPSRAKARLADYKKVPYDRGHLAPNADMATQAQQYDSFSLANIIPQQADNNRGIWRELESQVRFLTLQYGDVYVVSGTAYLTQPSKALRGRVLIPSHLYKAIYLPSRQQAGVYFLPNDDSQRVEVISLAELNQRVGIALMPTLSKAVQTTAMTLPLSRNIPSPTDKAVPQASLFEVIRQLFVALGQWLLWVVRA